MGLNEPTSWGATAAPPPFEFPTPEELKAKFRAEVLEPGVAALRLAVRVAFETTPGPSYTVNPAEVFGNRKGPDGRPLSAEIRRAIFQVVKDELALRRWDAKYESDQRDGDWITIRPSSSLNYVPPGR